MLAAAVRRGLRTPLLVGDLPFGSYEASDEQAIATAQRFVKEAGCDAVKLERGGTSVERARAIVEAGIPVMGHVGLTPQTATALGGYRAQGRTAERALGGRPRRARAAGGRLLLDRVRGDPGRRRRGADAAAGDPGDRDRRRAGHRRPGAGVPRPARHLRRARARGSPSATPTSRRRWSPAWPQYAAEVRAGAFPAPEHAYSIDDEELEPAFRASDCARRRPIAQRRLGARGGHVARHRMRRVPRLAQVFAPRDRVYFELFEEAGRNILQRRRAARPSC